MTKKNTTSTLAALVLLAGAAMAPSAFAQNVIQAQPSGVLSLAAQASADVPQDVVDITLFYEQEAQDPASLTSVLNQRADAALRQAKGVDNVTAHSGSFTVIRPRIAMAASPHGAAERKLCWSPRTSPLRPSWQAR